MVHVKYPEFFFVLEIHGSPEFEMRGRLFG